MKAAVVILIGVALVLGGALLFRHQKAEVQQKDNQAQILLLSNEWVRTQAKLTDQEKVNILLETNIETRVQEIANLSNKVADLSQNVARIQAQSQAAAKAAQEEMARRDTRINELEAERDGLTQKMLQLNTSIAGLETQISETERKLAASEGDRDLLLKELKRLQAEKAELERQFNDLAVLREQVRKLKEELSIARRLEWIRRGLFGEMKGAQRLQAGVPPPETRPGFDLDVEIKRTGEARVISTNPPPAKPPPPPR